MSGLHTHWLLKIVKFFMETQILWAILNESLNKVYIFPTATGSQNKSLIVHYRGAEI